MIEIVSPGTQVLFNQVPKGYAIHDLYFNLIPNDEQDNPVYDQQPWVGAFEVSYKE